MSARLGLSRIEIRGAFDCESSFKCCVPPHWVYPSGKKAFALLRLSPEIEVGVGAKAANHREEPAGKRLRLFEGWFLH